MANLTVIQGQDRGKVFDLRGTHIVMGRDPLCEVPLTDHSISRHHAELRVEEGKFLLVDLNSSNGTFVNGERTSEAVVRPGDQIRLGALIMTLGRVVTGPTVAGAGPVQIDEEGHVIDAAIQATVRSDLDPAVFLDRAEEDAHDRRMMESLRTLFKFSAAISSIFSTQQLVDTVLDLIFDVVDADRAFILLQDDPTGKMVPRAVRYRDQLISEIQAEQSAKREASGHAKQPILVSRTIVNACVTKGEGILSTNAMQDRRFNQGDSIQDLGIRSAICVPIRARDKILGVIHVDTQLQQAPFTKQDLQLMTALGYMTGLALENTRLVETALHRERLAAVGEAVASLSHYIKNILQGLQGGSSIIENGLKSNNLDNVARGWGIVSRNQGRIQDLVLNMLHYSGNRQPKLQRRNVNAIVREVVELAAPRAAEKQATIAAHLNPDLPEIWIDPEGIHHACLNILFNAVDAVESIKGRITVSTAVENRRSRDKEVADKFFVITIADNGVGISDDQLARLFRAFQSTKGHKGTGLGLAVSRKIIEEQQGSVEVESQVGAGTTFTLRLPIIQPSTSEDTLAPSQAVAK